jgi:hypothetical protein
MYQFPIRWWDVDICSNNTFTVYFCILKVFFFKINFYLFFLLEINIYLVFSNHFDTLVSKIIFKNKKIISVSKIIFKNKKIILIHLKKTL